ncbi:MAG: transporter [Microbacteriaceae bacterium]|nr:transporter [Microbacteriaceae bacterium]
MQQNNDVPTALSGNIDFHLLVGGQLVSQVGNQLQSLALPLVVLTLTGSAVQAGAILAISTATYLLFGLVAGALVDRWDRKRTMIWCEVGRAVLTASIPVAFLWNAVSIPQLYAVAIITGALGVLFQTANSTAMPHVVAPQQLPAALGISQAASSAVGIAGSGLAGAAYAVGRSIPFLVNVASFLVSAATLSAIRPQFQGARIDSARGPGDLLGEIREGLVWVWRQPVIRLLTIVEAADGLRYGAGYLLIIELARQVSADALQIGFVFGGAGLGGLVGGLLAARATKRYPLGRVAIVLLWAEAAAFPLYAFAPSWAWLALVALLESVLVPIYSVAMNNYRLTITPDRMRGRTNSAVSTLVTGAMSIGTIASGLLLEQIGATALALACAGWLLVLALATTASRTIRTAGAPATPRLSGTSDRSI